MGCDQREGLRVIVFPEGLVGCPEWMRFALLPGAPGSTVMRLQCLSDPSVCFIVADPQHVQPGYGAAIPKEEVLPLGLDCPHEGLVFCTLAVRGEPAVVTMNLLAPLVINPRSNLGKQLVLADSGYSARHPVGLADQGESNRPTSEGG